MSAPYAILHPQRRQARTRPPLPALAAAAALLAAGAAQGQMVPRTHLVTGHHQQPVVSTTPAGDLSTASVGLSARARSNGGGLALPEAATPGLWPHWEGRIGVVLDRPVDPLNSPFVLAQPSPSGLKVYSLHLLSDYYFSSGFRATAGLIRGAVGLPWWPSSQQGATGLNLSVQRLDTLGLPVATDRATDDEQQRTVPYLGAGYSARLSGDDRRYSAGWQFNADLGLISLNSRNIGRFTRVLQGDGGVEDLLREMRLRPVVKFSVNYAF